MSELNLEAFRQYFKAIHKCSPFPWQERLLERLLTGSKTWPEAITLPTASGKTSCIDIALFALAAQADLPQQRRTAPRRIAFVVDRRIIVDEAFDRAEHVGKNLRENNDAVVTEVADRLRRISGDMKGDPLAVVKLRGGVAKDHSWTRSATQPMVICSTVDQIGSRLLFRGYGLSDRALPIHAALLGNDTLILLDEAHIAEPFLQTANSVAFYRRQAEVAPCTPFQFVVMSATPPAVADKFPRTSEELEADRQHPILGERWKAPKPAKLVVAEGMTKKNFWTKLAEKLAEEALALVSDDRKVVAVLVNRVATARTVYDVLVKKHPGQCLLLTGRMRPVDSKRLVESAVRNFELKTSSAGERKLESPVFIVATQCLEVGADMDFDALVTECASLDALRQRFGRLNRSGRKIEARGTIVIRSDQTEAPKDSKDEDPVYGQALPRTWKWLGEVANDDTVDFGIEALVGTMASLSSEAAALLRVEAKDAPVMLPAHVDIWGQTNPQPEPSPDVALFLHGRSDASAEISLCWRLDLSSDLGLEGMLESLSLCPPASAECLNVPLWQFRQWLEAGAPTSTDKEPLALEADAPQCDPQAIDRGRSVERLPFIVCWRSEKTEEGEPGKPKEAGRKRTIFVLETASTSNRLLPSDTLIMPPESAIFWLGQECGSTENLDVGDQLQLEARSRPTLRLHPRLIATWPESQGKAALLELLANSEFEEIAEDTQELYTRIKDALGGVADPVDDDVKHKWLRNAAKCLVTEMKSLKKFERLLAIVGSSPKEIVLRSSHKWMERPSGDGGDDLFPETGFASSRNSRPVSLKEHSDGVENRVRHAVSVLDLPEDVKSAIATAASCHDLGKADPRFQAILFNAASRLLSLAQNKSLDQLLAKSARLPASRAAAEALRKEAGYPKGGRHELLSVRLAEQSNLLPAEGWERDLVLHLIAAHHGYCRPFAPAISDDSAPMVEVELQETVCIHEGHTSLERLDSGVAERFWRLVRRFGPWGLAYVECLLRLADQQQSSEEQTSDPQSS
ncbi:type I-U CRISPR-associated helicase/endonuclease Cas3 [Verrucomicrobium sp. BvORR034]|uniref:type I-G CRISPR-associated helicase/endonuclease Cas3g n=1 Tax=Verrucomicrobium sp. BvORR034 TaxID=1396418 RepID=UPI000678F325|nr:type I-U CRISPR-associated helicase/endonuclease Cas3 [Verrucomicrobium sp. BvORR034]